MGPSETGQLIAIIILLCLSAFFSSSETALTTVNQIRMRTLADNGDKRAARVLHVTGNPGKMLSAPASVCFSFISFVSDFKHIRKNYPIFRSICQVFLIYFTILSRWPL